MCVCVSVCELNFIACGLPVLCAGSMVESSFLHILFLSLPLSLSFSLSLPHSLHEWCACGVRVCLCVCVCVCACVCTWTEDTVLEGTPANHLQDLMYKIYIHLGDLGKIGCHSS